MYCVIPLYNRAISLSEYYSEILGTKVHNALKILLYSDITIRSQRLLKSALPKNRKQLQLLLNFYNTMETKMLAFSELQKTHVTDCYPKPP